MSVPMLADMHGFLWGQMKRPGVFATAGFLAIAAAIVGNALFLQPRHHPHPLFSEDAAFVPQESAAATPADTVSATPKPPAPRPEARAEPLPVPQPVVSDPLVAAVQNALAVAAYGPLSADGVMGAETRAAIMRFQSDHNLPVTGEISDALVLELTAAGAMTGG